ncbi:glycosyltransferase family A protein [Pseudohaliea sp.]|uniref:glycosyltransferase family 2 protein n=1 Tax=Pseudohaliea sp. TaxID=2740289 RepID=UPI0032ECF640
MAESPAFSVICPNYNGSLFLQACLTSVLEQTVDDLEVIVVDDGSTDDSIEVLNGLAATDPRVRIESQGNAGSAVARNHGIALARGSYIAFIDADDVWHPQKLEKQHELLLRATMPVACFSNFSLWPPERDGRYLAPSEAFSQLEPVDEFPGIGVDKPAFVYHLLLQDVFVWTSTVVVPSTVLHEVGGFDPSYRKGQDYDLWLRIAARYPFLRHPDSLALYRQHPDNITYRYSEVNYGAVIVENALRSSGLSSPDGQMVREDIMRRRLWKLWSDYADNCRHHGKYESAIRALASARHYRAHYSNSLRALVWRVEQKLIGLR